jgi:hypothetical protein
MGQIMQVLEEVMDAEGWYAIWKRATIASSTSIRNQNPQMTMTVIDAYDQDFKK